MMELLLICKSLKLILYKGKAVVQKFKVSSNYIIAAQFPTLNRGHSS